MKLAILKTRMGTEIDKNIAEYEMLMADCKKLFHDAESEDVKMDINTRIIIYLTVLDDMYKLRSLLY